MVPIKVYLLKKLVKFLGAWLLSKAAQGLKEKLKRWLFKTAQQQYEKQKQKKQDKKAEQSQQSRTYTGKSWQPPASAQSYLALIDRVEQQHRMPAQLLARLLWQECRFRPDIIKGDVISSAGAVGIAQIVPRWHPDVNPLDPHASIQYAGQYLAQLQKRFGDWPTALAAYNWGQGNVAKAQAKHGRDWLKQAPKETQNYVQQICQDLQYWT
ncbi:Transglycosylase SLT domain-containing protein [Oceanospirillum multiglobuliferum]|uniref:Transglycosylase SLT domain-containing protein n=1 Tax=Oceanospirillum multiglobuliferum TaxID=64969 RepID=A0A1T4MV39_9GAMM|nr:lytic transglycosylase domain-containing protein [Oceanospirillum multiglobuliferum]OPX56882.1 hypothetical protein BTE48_00140 [Oceanospirillum multiglobuliferum]SJZ70761.1 Transglycosylase SLT domain-containing protein [Oceanospirillum multiglobuliferum]